MPTTGITKVALTNAPLFDIDEVDEFGDSDSEYQPSDPSAIAAIKADGRRVSTRQRERTNFYGKVSFEDVAAFTCMAEMVESIIPSLGDDPTTLEEMRRCPDAPMFEAAIDTEHKSLTDKGVMVEVDRLPPGIKAIPTKYVLKRKLNERGGIEKHKARMVAQGQHQRDGKNFNGEELYAPTLDATTLRVVLANAVQLGHRLKQFDVVTAFLNAPLKEEIYITLPRGAKNALRPDGTPRVFRLLKALYGLKQAPREWNDEFDRTLTKVCGMTRLTADSCVYYRDTKSGDRIYLAIWVDDGILSVADADEAEAEEIIKKIKSQYDVSEGGEVKFLLGLHIQRTPVSLTINQKAYLERVLERADMSNCIPVSTPEEAGVKLTTFGSVSAHDDTSSDKPANGTEPLDEDDKVKYGSIVGGLLYAAVWTRPDIAHAVGELTRFMRDPKQAHMKAAMRVLRYLKGCTDLGLTYRKSDGPSKILLGPVFSDSNYASDPETRRSTTGVVVKVSNCTVAWFSRRQKCVTTSSTEAEYLALGDATKEVMWLRNMLKEMGIEQHGPTTIFGDNQASIITAQNETLRSKLKHIDVRYHFIKEKVKGKIIQLEWIPTLKQQADILTKGLGKNLFTDLRAKVMGETASIQA